MVLKKVGVVGTASSSDVLDGETFTSETEGGEATGSMPNRGVGDIDGPHDELSGAGYYSRIDNNIPDRGTLTINNQHDSGSAGYYDSINNSITDRGSLSNVTPGNYEYAGWYDAGTVPEQQAQLGRSVIIQKDLTGSPGTLDVDNALGGTATGYMSNYYYWHELEVEGLGASGTVRVENPQNGDANIEFDFVDGEVTTYGAGGHITYGDGAYSYRFASYDPVTLTLYEYVAETV